MGKVDRLCKRVEPFASCFGILALCQHLTMPAGPASLPRRTQSMSLFGHIVGSILNEDTLPPPPFPM